MVHVGFEIEIEVGDVYFCPSSSRKIILKSLLVLFSSDVNLVVPLINVFTQKSIGSYNVD